MATLDAAVSIGEQVRRFWRWWRGQLRECVPARIDRWLTHDTRSVNRGQAGWDDWQDEEFERPEPIRDVSVGEILEGALGIKPAKWTKGDQMRVGAWLKSRDWERYRSGAGATREWRYRRPQSG